MNNFNDRGGDIRMERQEKIEKCIDEINDIIIDNLGVYDVDDLTDVIVGVLKNHMLTSRDSLQNLIYEIEKLEDSYNDDTII